MHFVDLSSAPGDLELLARFYDELFVPGFPDEDERESLETFRDNLIKREAGFYERNNYHILLLVEGAQPVAASIFDYLATSNCGAIEYILAAEAYRGKGLGWKIHERSIELMREDARRAGNAELSAVMLEVNDPFQVSAESDNVDPFDRVLMWQRWGYRRLRFPYLQPALSAEQSAIDYLLLGVKVLDARLAQGFPPALARDMVVDYLVWANRLTAIADDPFYRMMSAYADTLATVPFEDFDRYIGREPGLPLTVTALDWDSGTDRARFGEAVRRLGGAGSLDCADPLNADPPPGGRPHAWLLQAEPGQGVAAFLTLPHLGFIACLGLDGAMRERGLARVVCKRIEERMIRERPDITHSYIACPPDSGDRAMLEAIGFLPLPDAEAGVARPGEGPAQPLLRKRLGDEIVVPPPDPAALARDLDLIARAVGTSIAE